MRPPKLIAAALGLVAVTTAAAPGWGPYVVHQGDSLWSIAQRQHTTVAALQQQNHLRGTTIYAGQVLEIPGLGAGAPAAQSPHTKVGKVVVSRAADPSYAASIAASARRLATSAQPSSAQIRAMVAAEARRQGVDPALAQAIATQESGCSMRIVSPTGAIGVMQLMPATAAWLGVDPYDLASNIRGGVHLLGILQTSTGSQVQAIGAYYQGLTSLRARGMYSDTKQYVANVQALMRRFR